MTEHNPEPSGEIGTADLTRRTFLKTGSVVGLAAASGVSGVRVARAQPRTIKIGYIGAQSGIGANFGEATPWTVERVRAAVKDGLKIGGKSYAVELVIKDNQSDPNRSAVVSSELVLRDKCDLVLCFGGDPAAAMGELADTRGVPTISTMVPWTGWKFSRGATPENLVEKSFPYTFHFFWGAAEVVTNFLAMWNSVHTNKVVGTFYIDSPTGRAFANPKTGLPGGMARHGYREVPGGFFKMATDDFTNQVSAFKNAGAEIVSGLVLPSHWATFWNQAAQAGYRPQVCTMAAAFLFASAVTSLGPRGDGMSTEVWWTPKFPYKSSITGQSARELATEWENTTGPWRARNHSSKRNVLPVAEGPRKVGHRGPVAGGASSRPPERRDAYTTPMSSSASRGRSPTSWGLGDVSTCTRCRRRPPRRGPSKAEPNR